MAEASQVISVSHVRLEVKLNQLIHEIRAGKHRSSVVSSQTFNGNDPNDWEELHRELEVIGISEDIIRDKRGFIIAWFEEAIEEGRLDEDESHPGSQEKPDPCGEDIGDMEEKPGQMSQKRQPETKIYEQPSSPIRTAQAPREKKPRSRLFYRLFALKSDLQYALKPDELLINAAYEGDALKVEELLGRGANVNYHSTNGWSKGQTALHRTLVGGGGATRPWCGC